MIFIKLLFSSNCDFHHIQIFLIMRCSSNRVFYHTKPSIFLNSSQTPSLLAIVTEDTKLWTFGDIKQEQQTERMKRGRSQGMNPKGRICAQRQKTQREMKNILRGLVTWDEKEKFTKLCNDYYSSFMVTRIESCNRKYLIV